LPSFDVVARRISMRELRLLLAVARSGSILKAAHAIGLTQPAISKAIADLEETLGVALFDRHHRGVVPTPHGRILVRHALAMFAAMRQAVEELDVLSGASGGEVCLGGTPAMCGGLLAHAVCAMTARRPGIGYAVVELETERLVAEVRAHTIDIGLGRAPLKQAGDDIGFEPLFEDRLFVVAAAGHPLAGRRTVSPAELAAQRWLLPPPQTPPSAQLRRSFESLKMEMPARAVSTMSMLLRYEMLAAGDFVTVLHGSLLQFGRLPSFLRILPVELSGGIPIGLSRVVNRTLSPATELFIECVRESAKVMAAADVRHLQRRLRSRSLPA
jgi:DNA-binding transcriptional LysR family regulator